MPTIILEDVPIQVYERLQRRADAHRRSMPEELLSLLQHALQVIETPTPRLPDYIPETEIPAPCDLPRSSRPVPVAAYAGSQDRIPRGTTVSGVKVGGRSPVAAAQALRDGLSTRVNSPITLVVGDRREQVLPAEMGLGVDYVASVRQAGAGTSWEPGRLWSYYTGDSSLDAVVTVSQMSMADFLTQLATDVGVAPRDGGPRRRSLCLQRRLGSALQSDLHVPGIDARAYVDVAQKPQRADDRHGDEPAQQRVRRTAVFPELAHGGVDLQHVVDHAAPEQLRAQQREGDAGEHRTPALQPRAERPRVQPDRPLRRAPDGQPLDLLVDRTPLDPHLTLDDAARNGVQLDEFRLHRSTAGPQAREQPLEPHVLFPPRQSLLSVGPYGSLIPTNAIRP